MGLCHRRFMRVAAGVHFRPAGSRRAATKRPIITGIVSKAYLDRLALEHDQHHAAVSGLDHVLRSLLPQSRPQPAA
jgi:hypothetical protein